MYIYIYNRYLPANAPCFLSGKIYLHSLDVLVHPWVLYMHHRAGRDSSKLGSGEHRYISVCI